MAIGRIGSFATTEAPQDYISGALQNVENQAFRYRAERRLVDEEKEKAKVEEEKQLAEHLKNFNIDLTGSQSIDDLSQSFAQDSFNQYAELARQLQTTKDPNERLKIRTQQARINQNISALKQIPGILKEKVEFITKNIDKLNPDDVDIVQNKLGMLEKGNAKIYLDENKVPRINIYKVDENGQVTDILEKEQTVAEFINGINPHMKSNYADMLEKAVKNTAVSDVTTQTGINIFQEKKVKDEIANEKAESFAEMIVNNPDEAYAFAKAKGIDINDKETLKEAVKKDFKNSLDVTTKQDVDSSLITATKPDKGSGKEEPQIMISKPSFLKKGGIVSGVKVQDNTQDFPLGNVIIKGSGGREQKATNVYVSPGGKMYLRVEESGNESQTIKEFDLTESGKKKLDDEKKKLGKAFNFNTFTQSGVLEPGDYKVGSTSTKAPIPRMLDFGQDAGEIGRYALKMGYNSAKEMQDDFIERAGGSKFITTPEQRKKSGSKPKSTAKPKPKPKSGVAWKK